MAEKLIKRGEVYWVKLPLPAENEQKNKVKKFRELQGEHPAVVVSNNEQNQFSPLITILPLTSQVDKIYSFQVESFLQGKRGVILIDQIRTIDRQRFGNRIGLLDELLMIKIEKALHITLSLKI